MEYKKIIEILKIIAVEAGNEILKYYKGDYNIDYKDDNSPLTSADKKANEIIVNSLKVEFPNYAILSEESYDNLNRINNEYCFIVDPLDGTKEFINNTDEFTVNIALSKNGKSILGVVYVPVSRELYYAYKGGGSFYFINGKETINKVSKRSKNLRLLSSKFHKSKEFLDLIERNASEISSVIGVGSSLKGCMIARGEAECYYRYGLTSEWDTAAMQIIVEEAGGVLKQLNDTEMRYNRKDTLNRLGFYIINNKKNHIK